MPFIFFEFLTSGSIGIWLVDLIAHSLFQEGSSRSENVKKFLACMDELGILKFELSDLETVIQCLSALLLHEN